MPRSDKISKAKSFRSMAFAVLLLTFTSPLNFASAADIKTSSKPNFLIILADDLGYTDLGAFGGEIDTPNLDRLANGGVRLINFYASPVCSPTRSMLLSGTDNHQAGLGNMAEDIAPNQQGQPGYEGYLNNRVVSLAEVMKAYNYRTYMAGKWHLGMEKEQGPAARGFDRSFALLQGGGSHFDQRGLAAASPKSLYRDNGDLVDLPKNFYSSDYYATKLISYLEADKDSSRPFLAYLAFTAPHWPLQAPEELIHKYDDRYKAGYQAIEKTRRARAEALGVVPKGAAVDETFPGHKNWTGLSDEERKTEARKMAVYAAMVDSMDQNVGRILAYLKDHHLMENTYVIFMSDNGAEGHDFAHKHWLDGWIEKFNNSYENMGHKGSYIWYGPNWAHVSMAPFRYGKAFPTEGGIHVPAFVYKDGMKTSGEISKAVLSVMDVMPTILDITGAKHPDHYNGHPVLPMEGHPFTSLLKGQQGDKNGAGADLGWELFGKRGFRYGDWKVVHMPPPYGTGEWQLYNLKTDPGETRDLAGLQPDKLHQLVGLWGQYAKQNNVIIPNQVSGY